MGRRRRRGGRVEVGVKSCGEPVGKVSGDRQVGLVQEFSGCVGGGGKVADNKGVDNF